MTHAIVVAALATATMTAFVPLPGDEGPWRTVVQNDRRTIVPKRRYEPSLRTVVVQDQAPNRRDVTIVAREFQFVPDRIEVAQGDLVRIQLTSEDRPYSFAIDAYRIVKRAGARQTIVFDFRADQPGTFPFYCNLTSAPQCKEMRGTLVVRER
jgi:heme/copper-type cytochrome/quinol oxidase subunit 2